MTYELIDIASMIYCSSISLMFALGFIAGQQR